MTDVTFVFTNPRHHFDMMAPVARELRSRGIACHLVSLAELRGFKTPRNTDLPVHAGLPFNLRRTPQIGASAPLAGGVTSLRSLARRAVSAIVVPVVRRLIGQSRVVVIPNDSAFPYDRLVPSLRARVVLMQEGIRFRMPNGDAYGTSGIATICAWGEGSREFFIQRGVDESRCVVTGSPRHDHLHPGSWTSEGRALLARLGLAQQARPIAMLSNPIEHQGYGSARDKLELFERFVRHAEPMLRARGISLIVKNHAYEDPAEFARVAARTPAADIVHVDAVSPLFAALSIAAGAVVLTSTAGIEALMFDVPIAALELPGGGYGFEYVERGAAVGLRGDAIGAGILELLDGADARRTAGARLVQRHLHDRGRASQNVADVIARLLGE